MRKKKDATDVGRSMLDRLMRRNVGAIKRIEQIAHDERSGADRVSDAIAGFCGSPLFLYVHCAWFGTWLFWNGSGFLPIDLRFDPAPFNTLMLVVVLEAIFLSTFILISQNRQQRLADQRNHLDLQINLLAEQESSQMLIMMKKVMDHLGIENLDGETEGLRHATDPERLVEHIQKANPLKGDTADSPPDA